MMMILAWILLKAFAKNIKKEIIGVIDELSFPS
jgi:hypothetical protein